MVASTELNEFLADKWTGVAQVFQLVRTVTKKGQTSEEVVYGLTALSPVQAEAEDLLALVREHWKIEIVQSQMTKTNGFSCGRGWDHITDLNLLPGDHNTVN